MTGLERVARAVAFEPADRPAVIAQVFGGAATMAGVPLDQYVRDGQTLARCQLAAWKQFGYDAVFSVMDANVETEAVGSALTFRPNQYPVIQRHVLNSHNDVADLAMPDPRQAGRMSEMLKALEIMRSEIGDQAVVVGCVLGPFTLATQLMGIEQALYLAIDDCPKLERVMDFATEVVIAFGLAQLRAGAHLAMVFDPAASPAVIPPQFFREFELPRLRRVFKALVAAGSAANWLHIAGPVKSILPYYPQADVQIANFDYCVNPGDAGGALPQTCLDGNIRSLAFVDAEPADIAAAAGALLHGFGERGGFILSSGCEIPPESKPQNIAAMVDAARSAR